MNVNMDLAPFLRINPCGYAGLVMTQLSALGGETDVPRAAAAFGPRLVNWILAALTRPS
jgi:lipoyl(octanoyl) transferase